MLRAVFGIVISASLICAAALLVGQVALRLCGAGRWSWLSPAVGVALLMLVATPALHLPGRSITVAVVLALLVAGCTLAAIRDPALRPPLGGVVAALPVGLLTLVPFAASGYAGTIGVSFNNDMTSHLIWADAYRSEAIASVTGFHSGYPLGPHALVAAIAESLGLPIEQVFAGLTVAIPLLLGWTALAALRSAAWPAQVIVVTVVGLPFLIAGYYSQGSFKELLQATFVLALAVFLQRRDDFSGPLRWAPAALLIAGTLSVYSGPGLIWPVAILGAWVAGLLAERVSRGDSPRAIAAELRGSVAGVAAGLAVLVVVLIPQIPRIVRFVRDNASTNGTGIDAGDLGNLAGRLPFWEAFGVWDNPDYRLPAIDPLTAGVTIGLVLALVAVGAVWWTRRGEWAVPLAAVATAIVWVLSDRLQSPYVAAKALAILTPFLMLIAVRPLVERASLSSPWPLPWRLAAPAIAIVLTGLVASSSWGALRIAKIGPSAHYDELRSLKPLLGDRPTLFLGNDDFIRWELAGVPVAGPVIGFQAMATRPEKPYVYGEPLDIDSLAARQLNDFDWIVTPRDAAGSGPRAGMRLVRQTPSFQLWRRVAPIQRRETLAEGANAGAPFDCGTSRGRRLLRRGGIAAVRRPSVVTPVGPLPAGATHEIPLPLADGRWTLQMQYDSQSPIEVSAPGLSRKMPASLDRPGTRWHIGRTRVAGGDGVVVSLRVTKPRLAPDGRVAQVASIVSTPVGGSRTVPLRAACGKYVDWIAPRRSQR
jgi:hypothetical protein